MNSFKTISLALVIWAFVLACSPPKGTLFQGAFNAGEPRLFITSVTAGVLTVSVYDLTGKFIGVIGDFTAQNLSPRGLVPLDFFNFAIALDGTDQIGRMNLFGEFNTHIVNANLTGNLYGLRRRFNGELFVIETNFIESFSSGGSRIGNPRVATTVGACTLNTPRGLFVTSDDRLITVATGNDDINVYDISDPTPACVTSNQTMGNTDPISVIAHSNGQIYVATQGDDSIYEFNGDGTGTGTVIFNNLSVISNPTAIVELPDGTMLVASDLTNSIERIDTAGNRIGSTPFISNAFTGSVGDMMIMPEIR